MTAPLGNTPTQRDDTPEELKTEGLLWMSRLPLQGQAPVIVFYRTIEHGTPFAPKATNIDPATGRPKLVKPVTVDLFFPNGPLAGKVYRRVGFINAGINGPVLQTAIGSINVGQLGIGNGPNGDYAQLNPLDPDALAWASKIHQEAGGDVFAHYGGGPSAPVQAAAPTATAAPVDRFAGMPVPGAQAAPSAPAATQPQPTTVPPPPGVPQLGAPTPAASGQSDVPPWARGQ